MPLNKQSNTQCPINKDATYCPTCHFYIGKCNYAEEQRKLTNLANQIHAREMANSNDSLSTR